MKFVLDTLVVASWLLKDAGPGEAYAVAALQVLGRVDAGADDLDVEIANRIRREARGILNS